MFGLSRRSYVVDFRGEESQMETILKKRVLLVKMKTLRNTSLQRTTLAVLVGIFLNFSFFQIEISLLKSRQANLLQHISHLLDVADGEGEREIDRESEGSASADELDAWMHQNPVYAAMLIAVRDHQYLLHHARCTTPGYLWKYSPPPEA